MITVGVAVGAETVSEAPVEIAVGVSAVGAPVSTTVGGTVVAADAVGAGVGEVVLYASGSSARQTETTNNRPVDATIMAIVDAVELGGEQQYTK